MYVVSFIFMIVCAVVLPVALAVIFCVRGEENWKPLLFGALTYIFFQVLLRFPLLQMLFPQYSWFSGFSAANPALYALFLGGTAALFEEGGRFAVISLFLRKQRTTADGIAFGVGHGGMEAIILAGINSAALLLSSGTSPASGIVLAGAIERLSILAIQIAFSVMVMKSVRERKPLWLLAPFAMHTLVGSSTVFAADSADTWTIELSLFAVAALLSWFTVREYYKDLR